MKFPKCEDKRKCFAKRSDGRCNILSEVYINGACPLCKSDRENVVIDLKERPLEATDHMIRRKEGA